MDFVLVDDFIGSVDGWVRGALAVLNNRDDLHSQHATLSIPFLDSL